MNTDELCTLSIESGILCAPDFGTFHEYVEKLLGHPVWTHEFAMPETLLDMKIALLSGRKTERTQSPIDTLLQLVPKEKKVIAVVSPPKEPKQ